MKKKINITKIILFYIIVPIFFIGTMYLLLPMILNYPPNSIDNALQKDIDGLTYTEQFILNSFLGLITEIGVLLINTRRINKILIKLDKNLGNKQELLNKITKLCLTTPLKIYFAQVIIPSIILPLVIMLIGADIAVVFKISIIFILFFSLSATMTYVLTQKEFKKLICSIYENENEYNNNIIDYNPKLKIQTKLILELMPLVTVALIFTSLLAYTMNAKTSGDIYYKIYSNELEKELKQKTYYNIEDIINELNNFHNTNNDNITKFIISRDGKYITLNNNKLSDFFVKYTLQNQETNRTYDYYCIDKEGTYIKIKTLDENEYFVGVQYVTSSKMFLYTLLISFVFLLFIILGNLVYIAMHLSKDIKLITDGLNKILKEKDLKKKIIVTTNDETGELTHAFNEIQKLTDDHITQIEENQHTMERQAQFAILGEFAGGLAHDLNSPLSAVKLDIETIKKYINSNKINAEDNVKERLNSILFNIDNGLSNMEKTIAGVRNQIRSTGDTEKDYFYLIDVIDGINVLFRSLLLKNNCQISVNVPTDLKVYGEKNKLDRVISNLVKNSIDAYVEKNIKGIIQITAEIQNNLIIIKIKDKAGGIEDNIKDKIFKEINTTKRDNGTGFGLYFSNTIIEGSFKGKMYFETEKNVGSTFIIELPNVMEE